MPLECLVHGTGGVQAFQVGSAASWLPLETGHFGWLRCQLALGIQVSRRSGTSRFVRDVLQLSGSYVRFGSGVQVLRGLSSFFDVSAYCGTSSNLLYP